MLPRFADDDKLSLGEGNTPLVKSRNLGPALGLKNLYFKLEMLNPSGSYKDRFAACAVSDLLRRKSAVCFATSSGNTGAALAAYCAAARIGCFLLIVDGAPAGKVQQMRVYGAETLMIKDFGKDFSVTQGVLEELEKLSSELNSLVQVSAYCYNPVGMAGVQTIAYEIAEALSGSCLQVFSPAGGGGLTLAMLRGFEEWQKWNPDFKLPRLHCVQPRGNDTISGPLRTAMGSAEAISRSSTAISGLQVPNILDGNEVVSGCRALGGTGFTVTDDLVYRSQEELACKEGIFCEPAGAVALAGLKMALDANLLNNDDTFVCLVTGTGFKDPVRAVKMAEKISAGYFESSADTFRYIRSKINLTHKHAEK